MQPLPPIQLNLALQVNLFLISGGGEAAAAGRIWLLLVGATCKQEREGQPVYFWLTCQNVPLESIVSW